MFFATLAALAAGPWAEPSLADLDRFPLHREGKYGGAYYQPQEQANLCRELRVRLEYRWHADPWSREHEKALATLALWERYWGLLWLASQEGYSEAFRLDRLHELRDLIGEEAYRRGWSPSRITADMLPEVPRVARRSREYR